MTLGHAKEVRRTSEFNSISNVRGYLPASLVGLLQDQVSSQAQGQGACLTEMRLALSVTWAIVFKGACAGHLLQNCPPGGLCRLISAQETPSSGFPEGRGRATGPSHLL